MKKFGFTLAEILVALGIIGVIAAMTMPTFTASTANAKIGPSLATAVSNFEQANAAMLQAHNVEKISDLNIVKATDLAAVLQDNFKMSYVDSENHTAADITTKNNITYRVWDVNSSDLAAKGNNAGISANAPHRLYRSAVMIDINGTAEPNSNGKDRFWFGMFEDGSLRPKGGHMLWNNIDPITWDNEGVCDASGVKYYEYCAGSIFENNLKVIYN